MLYLRYTSKLPCLLEIGLFSSIMKSFIHLANRGPDSNRIVLLNRIFKEGSIPFRGIDILNPHVFRLPIPPAAVKAHKEPSKCILTARQSNREHSFCMLQSRGENTVDFLAKLSSTTAAPQNPQQPAPHLLPTSPPPPDSSTSTFGSSLPSPPSPPSYTPHTSSSAPPPALP